jgi:hypothetical protein
LDGFHPLNLPRGKATSSADGRKELGGGFESIEFKRWLNGNNKTLFCPGIPRAGKTMLSSIVIDYLQKSILDEHTHVAYIFCNSQSKLEQTPVNLVASLLKRLLQAKHGVPEDLKSLYE